MNEQETDGVDGDRVSDAADTWPLSAREAAAVLGVSERTVRRAIARGELLAVMHAGVYRIAPADLARHARRRQLPGPPTAGTLPEPTRLIPFPGRKRAEHPALPQPLTPLIGREDEAATAAARLGRDEVRLLTLTGPGGVGKTRLALRAAAEVAGAFVDGVVFVSLAPIADPELVAATVADALGLPESRDRRVREQLRAYLAGRHLLLVLDNFEHVLPSAPLVADLLGSCSALKVLATSRAPLNVSGEHVLPVPPLAVPDEHHAASVERVDSAAAVRLFVARAQAATPDFVLTKANAATVAAIVRRLDGMPLAIELAAARSPALPPDALAVALDRPLSLLTGGPVDAPPRLRTLRGAIAWSYDLLTPEEQALFRRLAVFAGGFTLEAAHPVAGTGDGTVNGIVSLVDKSLLHRDEPPSFGGDARAVRFGMLETVREYGLEQLGACGEEEATRRRHAEWGLALAENAEREMWGPGPGRVLDRLQVEYSNLRVVLTWAWESGNIETGLRVTAALWNYHTIRGQLIEPRRWQERLLAAASQLSPSVRATALLVAGDLARHAGDYGTAIPYLEECAALARQAGDSPLVALTLLHRSFAAEDLGDHNRQCALGDEALGQFRALGDAHWPVEALLILGRGEHMRGNHGKSRNLLEEAVALAQERRIDLNTAWALCDLANFLVDEGDDERAATMFGEAIRLLAAHGDHLALGPCLLGLGTLAAANGQPDVAASYLGAADAVREARGMPWSLYQRAMYDRCKVRAQIDLGAEGFAAAWAAGTTMTLDQLVAGAAQIATGPARRAAAGGRRSAKAGILTARERAVLSLVADGRSDREIAASLAIGERTVESHLANAFNKLGVNTRAAAAAAALRLHLI